MRRRKWALLAILLGMMVVVSGCFGGGGTRETGGVTGRVLAPREDVDMLATVKGHLIKDVVVTRSEPIPEPIYENYVGLSGAIVTAIGTGKLAKTGSDGRFILDRIPVGMRTISISHPAYKGKYTTMVSIEANVLKPFGTGRVEGKGFYLLIGVGEYSANRFWEDYGYLDPTDPDDPQYFPTVISNDVAIMKSVFSADNALLGKEPIVRIGRDATIEGVIAALEELIYEMKRGDYLVVYFSGHGIGGDDHSFDGIALYDDFMADYELRVLIEDIMKDQGLSLADVTLILDCCNSGSFADGSNREKRKIKAFKNPGYTVIASSDRNEESITRKYSPDSLFTYYLAEGLGRGLADDGDGVIYASELYQYLRRKVASEAPAQNVYRYLGIGDPVIFKTIDY